MAWVFLLRSLLSGDDALVCVIMWKCLNDFYYPFFFRFYSQLHTKVVVVDSNDDDDDGKLLSAHNRRTGEKCFHVVLSMMESQGQNIENRRQNIRKLRKNSFSAFLSVSLYSVYYPRRSIHVRRNEMERWQNKGKDDVTVEKSIISHCLIVLLLISLTFINHYRFRSYVPTVPMYKLILYSDGALRIRFLFFSSTGRRGIYEHDVVLGKIKVIKIIQMRRPEFTYNAEQVERGDTHCW